LTHRPLYYDAGDGDNTAGDALAIINALHRAEEEEVMPRTLVDTVFAADEALYAPLF
jgi:hypothetical protein